ncbi:uncharacterized protein LOC110655621 [Hevea brasiliensis]|uniref:uncharacterized protein LOC110655621 n=1 Tax=Hevea brasiliensis TaxID=3981 RepID=UPI0025D73DA1|nr:uncharacterized protein LOC110655621 [Hevea brasiliensis]
MAPHENQKKGFMMNFYKSRQKSHQQPNIMTNNTELSHNFLSRKSKNYEETVHGGARVVEGGRGRLMEGRKSVSHVETNLGSVASFLQVKVLVTDMPGFMQVHAFRCARRTYDSLDRFSSKHMAYNIKKELDKVYGPAWHCIVGSSFGSFVTHSTGCFLYFSMENLYILVFKTKVQRALEN